MKPDFNEEIWQYFYFIFPGCLVPLSSGLLLSVERNECLLTSCYHKNHGFYLLSTYYVPGTVPDNL